MQQKQLGVAATIRGMPTNLWSMSDLWKATYKSLQSPLVPDPEAMHSSGLQCQEDHQKHFLGQKLLW